MSKSEIIPRVIDTVGAVFLGKEEKVKIALACFLAKGHLLIEDLPGMGKTLFSHALAKSLGLSYKRMQFTSDTLPSDIIGMSVYDQENNSLKFVQGPVFTQVLLADEINRCSPKTQSALLESMEENQVTVEGKTFPLPEPFFVIATQNPVNQGGTYPLPESQLDRFLVCMNLGYPDPEIERELMQGKGQRELLDSLSTVCTIDDLHQLRKEASAVNTSDALISYVQRICQLSREDEKFAPGISTRGGLAIVSLAKAWAYLDGRDYVLPEDVKDIFSVSAAHRLNNSASRKGNKPLNIANLLINQIDVIA